MLLLLLLLRLLFADTFILDFCSFQQAAFLELGCAFAQEPTWLYEFKMNNLTRNEKTRKILQIDNNNSSNSNKSVPFRYVSFRSHSVRNVESDERKTKQLKNDIFTSTTIVLMIFRYGNA